MNLDSYFSLKQRQKRVTSSRASEARAQESFSLT